MVGAEHQIVPSKLLRHWILLLGMTHNCHITPFNLEVCKSTLPNKIMRGGGALKCTSMPSLGSIPP